MQPCYKWWEVPFYWSGLKLYDVIAGSQGLEWSRYLTPGQARGEWGGGRRWHAFQGLLGWSRYLTPGQACWCASPPCMRA